MVKLRSSHFQILKIYFILKTLGIFYLCFAEWFISSLWNFIPGTIRLSVTFPTFWTSVVIQQRWWGNETVSQSQTQWSSQWGASCPFCPSATAFSPSLEWEKVCESAYQKPSHFTLKSNPFPSFLSSLLLSHSAFQPHHFFGGSCTGSSSAAPGLSLVVENGGYPSLWWAGFSLRWLLLLQSRTLVSWAQ